MSNKFNQQVTLKLNYMKYFIIISFTIANVFGLFIHGISIHVFIANVVITGLIAYFLRGKGKPRPNELLVKYMRHVKEIEGRTYCGELNKPKYCGELNRPQYSDVKFTEQEVKELQSIAINYCDEKYYCYLYE